MSCAASCDDLLHERADLAASSPPRAADRRALPRRSRMRRRTAAAADRCGRCSEFAEVEPCHRLPCQRWSRCLRSEVRGSGTARLLFLRQPQGRRYAHSRAQSAKFAKARAGRCDAVAASAVQRCRARQSMMPTTTPAATTPHGPAGFGRAVAMRIVDRRIDHRPAAGGKEQRRQRIERHAVGRAVRSPRAAQHDQRDRRRGR